MYTLLQFLFEGRVEDTKKKYPNVNVDMLAQLDPSPTKKYVMWMAKQRSKKHALEDIGPTVNEFDRVGKNLQKKSIDQYDDLKELEDALKEYDFKKSANKKEKSAHQDAEFITEENGYQLYLIKSHAASCQLGRGTKWCITMSDSMYWDSYEAANKFFFCIPTSANDEKFALQLKLVPEMQITDTREGFVVKDIDVICWNSKDKKVAIPNELLNHVGAAKKTYLNRFAKKELLRQNEGIFPITPETFTNLDTKFGNVIDNNIAKNFFENARVLKIYNERIVDQLTQKEINEIDTIFLGRFVDRYQYTSPNTKKVIPLDASMWKEKEPVQYKLINNELAYIITDLTIVAMVKIMSNNLRNKDIMTIIDRIAKTYGHTIDDIQSFAEDIIDRVKLACLIFTATVPEAIPRLLRSRQKRRAKETSTSCLLLPSDASLLFQQQLLSRALEHSFARTLRASVRE